jgi:hypothetical protein
MTKTGRACQAHAETEVPHRAQPVGQQRCPDLFAVVGLGLAEYAVTS